MSKERFNSQGLVSTNCVNLSIHLKMRKACKSETCRDDCREQIYTCIDSCPCYKNCPSGCTDDCLSSICTCSILRHVFKNWAHGLKYTQIVLGSHKGKNFTVKFENWSRENDQWNLCVDQNGILLGRCILECEQDSTCEKTCVSE